MTSNWRITCTCELKYYSIDIEQSSIWNPQSGWSSEYIYNIHSCVALSRWLTALTQDLLPPSSRVAQHYDNLITITCALSQCNVKIMNVFRMITKCVYRVLVINHLILSSQFYHFKDISFLQTYLLITNMNKLLKNL